MFILKYASETTDIKVEFFPSLRSSRERMLSLWKQALSNALSCPDGDIYEYLKKDNASSGIIYGLVDDDTNYYGEWSREYGGNVTGSISGYKATLSIDGDSITDFSIEKIVDNALGIETPAGRLCVDLTKSDYGERPAIKIFVDGDSQTLLSLVEYINGRSDWIDEHQDITRERSDWLSGLATRGFVTRSWPDANDDSVLREIYHYGIIEDKEIRLATYQNLTKEEQEFPLQETPLVTFTIRQSSLKKLLDRPVDEFLKDWTMDEAKKVYNEAKAKWQIVSENAEPCLELDFFKMRSKTLILLKCEKAGSTAYTRLQTEVNNCTDAIKAFQQKQNSILASIALTSTSSGLVALINKHLRETWSTK